MSNLLQLEANPYCTPGTPEYAMARRGVLTLLGIFGTALISGCMPDIEIPIGDEDNFLRFAPDIETLIAEHYEAKKNEGKVRVYEYGSINKPYRTISINTELLIPRDDSHNSHLEPRIEQYKQLLDKYENATITQEMVDGVWQTMQLPCSLHQLEMVKAIMPGGQFLRSDLVDTEGSHRQTEAIALLTEAVSNPTLTDEALNNVANSYVEPSQRDYFISWIKSYRDRCRPIPECMGIEPLVDFWLTNMGLVISPPSPEDNTLMLNMANHCPMLWGAQMVPRLDTLIGEDSRGETMKDHVRDLIEHQFVDVPQPSDMPTVYYVVHKPAIGESFIGNINEMLVSFQDPGTLKFYNTQEIVGLTKEQYSADGWETVMNEEGMVSEAEIAQICKDHKINREDLISVHKLSQSKQRFAVVPNSLVGMMKARIAPYLLYFQDEYNELTGVTGPVAKMKMLGRMTRDVISPNQYQDRNFSWSTDVTDWIHKCWEDRITKVTKLGLLKPSDFMIRAMNGFIGGRISSHGAWLPESPVFRDMLANTVLMGVDDPKVFDSYENANYFVCVREFTIPGYTDPLTGNPVTMRPGDVMPLKEVLQAPNGERFVLLDGMPTRDWKGVWDGNTSGLCVIPQSVAMECAISLDPDNNILQATLMTAKVFAIVGSVYFWLAYPEVAGAAVTQLALNIRRDIVSNGSRIWPLGARAIEMGVALLKLGN